MVEIACLNLILISLCFNNEMRIISAIFELNWIWCDIMVKECTTKKPLFFSSKILLDNSITNNIEQLPFLTMQPTLHCSKEICQVWRAVDVFQDKGRRIRDKQIRHSKGGTPDHHKQQGHWRTDNCLSHLCKPHLSIWEHLKNKKSHRMRSRCTSGNTWHDMTMILRPCVQPEASAPVQIIRKRGDLSLLLVSWLRHCAR